MNLFLDRKKRQKQQQQGNTLKGTKIFFSFFLSFFIVFLHRPMKTAWYNIIILPLLGLSLKHYPMYTCL